jgi:hypothetical protein
MGLLVITTRGGGVAGKLSRQYNENILLYYLVKVLLLTDSFYLTILNTS